MATTDLMVGIGAEYKGKAAFKKADNDILGLGKGVKQLAKAYIGLQGAQKAFRYGQASLKAFVADDKAARQLTQTVNNLGLSYEATNVANFIAGLEQTYHVADDLLRPAFARLIQVTQSYTKSKEIMTTALNAAAGAGVDLSTTVQDLSQAYVGNLKGLKKYNLGLTNAELATMSFQEIQDKLNQTFTGQASLAAETYAGKMDALAIASNNAKEIIGKGLVDAISAAFGGGSIEKATTNIEKMAGVIADIVAGLGTIAGFFGKVISLTDKLTPGYQVNKANAAKAANAPYDPRSGNMPDMSPAALKVIAARKKADADAVKRQKELAALSVKQTKAIKEQTLLAKAKALLEQSSMVLNMDLIQNTAALMGKITADEALRLKLQQAILLGNEEAAGNLAQKLLSSQIEAVKLASLNPVNGWAKYFNDALAALQQLRDELAKLGAPKTITTLELDAQTAILDASNFDFEQILKDTDNARKDLDKANALAEQLRQKMINDGLINGIKTNLPSVTSVSPQINLPPGFAGFGPTTGAASQTQEIRITLDPKASQLINAEVVKANANGSQSTVNRNGFFNYGG
jgi:hypothetical protein